MTPSERGDSVGPVIAAARASLLAWYDQHARDLPWRRLRDPYAIWVSEVMLQQTRVDTVIPYFERFLARFPTAASLSSAAEDEVLALWSGLGYYRRARLLHRGVAEAVARYGGVPREASARRALPGIGPYTAGAIGSIAFDLPEAIVDGNVARVLARFHRIETPVGETKTQKRLWSLAGEWADGERPGALNQGLMELGALVCTPTSPRCGDCPIAEGCEARRNDEQTVLPIVAAKTKPRAVELRAAVLRDPEGRVLLVRGDSSLFGGLYGAPMSEEGKNGLDDVLSSIARGVRLAREPAATVGHVLSHRSLSVAVHLGEAESLVRGTSARFFDEAELATVGIAKLTRKLLTASSAGASPNTPPTRAPRRAGRSRASARGRAEEP